MVEDSEVQCRAAPSSGWRLWGRGTWEGGRGSGENSSLWCFAGLLLLQTSVVKRSGCTGSLCLHTEHFTQGTWRVQTPVAVWATRRVCLPGTEGSQMPGGLGLPARGASDGLIRVGIAQAVQRLPQTQHSTSVTPQVRSADPHPAQDEHPAGHTAAASAHGGDSGNGVKAASGTVHSSLLLFVNCSVIFGRTQFYLLWHVTLGHLQASPGFPAGQLIPGCSLTSGRLGSSRLLCFSGSGTALPPTA